MGVSLKCGVCKENIDYETDDSYTYWGHQYFHGTCFVKKKMNMKKAAWSEKQCLDYINSHQAEVQQKVQQCIVKDDFYQWIMEYYQIQVIPSHFFTKIADITAGKYKGLATPIPIEDIHDMWKRKANYLTKIYLSNESSGKTMNPDQRLSYDLAVLINKYDSYLSWKNELSIEQKEAQTRMQEQKTTTYSLPVKPSVQDCGINIYDIIDEI